jgi:hypothetical protein
VGDLVITLKESCFNITWDSKTGLIWRTDTTLSKHMVRFSGKSYGTIPVTEFNKPVEIYYKTIENDKVVKYYPNGKKVIEGVGTEIVSPIISIEYDYWYY